MEMAQDHVVAVQQLPIPQSIIKYGAEPMETELGPPTGPHPDKPGLRLTETADAFQISGPDDLHVEVCSRPHGHAFGRQLWLIVSSSSQSSQARLVNATPHISQYAGRQHALAHRVK